MRVPRQVKLVQFVEAELRRAQEALVARPASLEWQGPLQTASRLLGELRISDVPQTAIPDLRVSLENIRALLSRCELLLDSGLFFLCGCNASLNESHSGYGPDYTRQVWAEAGT